MFHEHVITVASVFNNSECDQSFLCLLAIVVVMERSVGMYRGVVFIYSTYLGPMFLARSGSSKRATATSMYIDKITENRRCPAVCIIIKRRQTSMCFRLRNSFPIPFLV